jgi:hypothetical protein
MEETMSDFADAAKKIDAGETMAEMWDGFAEAVIPFATRGGTQYEEMRRAFYSGALCLFNWFMVQMDEDREPTAADLGRVDKIEEEIRGFLSPLGGERRVQ